MKFASQLAYISKDTFIYECIPDLFLFYFVARFLSLMNLLRRKKLDPLLLTSALNAGLQILLKLFITTFIISKIFIFQIILAKAGTLMQILYYYYSGI